MQDGKSSRPWRVIAKELTHETNRDKIIALSLELNRALAEQGLDSRPLTPQRIMRHAGHGRYFCAICRESIDVTGAKTNDDGQLVHEDCYANRISAPPRP